MLREIQPQNHRFSHQMEHEDLGEGPCAIEDLATTVHAPPLPPEDLMRARGPK